MLIGIIYIAASLGLSTQLSRNVGTNFDFTNLVITSINHLPQCFARFLQYPPKVESCELSCGHKASTFKLNPEFWLKGIDFSCVSPWDDSFGSLRAGTAISKRHIILSKHFELSAGERIAFVGNKGDISHYRVVATRFMKHRDVMIGLLDYELTPDILPAKVLPPDFEKWLTDGSRWPLLTFNQKEEVHLSELVCKSDNEKRTLVLENDTCDNPVFKKFSGLLYNGDSGNPAFMLYQGNPILLYCVLHGGIGLGPMIHDYRKEIQQLMDELCPGYKLETFDFESKN